MYWQISTEFDKPAVHAVFSFPALYLTNKAFTEGFSQAVHKSLPAHKVWRKE